MKNNTNKGDAILAHTASRQLAAPAMNVWLLAAFILLGLFARMVHLYDGVGGDHTFRQSHVANEIRSLKDDQQEPILKPFELFNNRFGELRTIYDTPIYQFVVAKISDMTSIDYVVLAKVTNLFIYVATAVALIALFLKFTQNNLIILSAVFIFAVSPLSIHYFSAVIPDNLPILLSVVSLWFFLDYEEKEEPRLLWYSLLAGVISAVIKPPIYFTVALALVLYRSYSYGWRDPFRGRMLVFFSVLLLAVMAYSVTTSYLNWGEAKDNDYFWYFGELQHRLQWSWWKPFFVRLFKEFASPVVSIFFLVGIYKLYASEVTKYNSLLVSWLIACLFTSLVFFNVHSLHNYYQLPFIPVFVLVAALGCSDMVFRLSRRLGGPLYRSGVMVLVTVLSLGWAFDGSRVMTYGSAKAKLLESEALFVREHTPESGFVIWEGCSTHPLALYLATRRGYCVDSDKLTDDTVNALLDRFHGGRMEGVTMYVLQGSAAKISESLSNKAAVALSSPNPAWVLYRL